MFNAPTIITDIPDIDKIYEINDGQIVDLYDAVDRLDDNIFFNSMHEEQIERWEEILKIAPKTGEDIDSRRFKVKTKVFEHVPYTERVINRKLADLCPDGYKLDINDDRTHVDVTLVLWDQGLLSDVEDMLEEIIPLNMTFTVVYNSIVEQTLYGSVGLAMNYRPAPVIDGYNQRIAADIAVHSNIGMSQKYISEAVREL